MDSFDSIRNGKDCFIKSQTGSGKTLAYLAPIIDYLMNRETKITRQLGPVVLIVAPTRELSIQIFNLFNKLNKVCVHIVAGLLIGGESVKSEKEKIRKGINLVIGTPGKILYHMKNTKGL